MLRTLSELHDYTIGAVDGAIGHVKDLYLDDGAWVVRYLVVETGDWLSSRRVLISPMALGAPDWENRKLPVSVTKEQVRSSPDVDTEQPVTRQHEEEYSGYYGFPYYWGGTGFWGGGMYPNTLMTSYGSASALSAMQLEADNARARAVAHPGHNDDPHLRSCAAIDGYHLHASDGEIGHACGMLIDDETWAVRYLIVDTSNWWIGHQLLVAPAWITGVSWLDATVSVKLARQEIKDAPAYDSGQRLTRDHETRLHEHYARTGYWTESAKRETDISRI